MKLNTLRNAHLLLTLLAALWSAELRAHHAATYAGHWTRDAEEAIWHQVQDLETLKHRAHDLELRGFVLADIEVWLERGKRHYLGIFRRGSGSRSLGQPAEGPAFKREIRRNRHRCLLAFEAWRERGRAHYLGLWGPGCGRQRIELGLDTRTFHRKLRQSRGQRLVGFETVLVGNELELSALWRAGVEGPKKLFLAADWDDFHQRIHHLDTRGMRLVDLEIHRSGEDLFYSGLWRPGSGDDWLGVGYLPDWFRKANRNLARGVGKSALFDPSENLQAPGSEHRRLHLSTLEVVGYLESPLWKTRLAADSAPPRVDRAKDAKTGPATPRTLALEPFKQSPRIPITPSHEAPKHDSGSTGPD